MRSHSPLLESSESFDRHVVLGAREGAADVLVEAVAEDAIGLRAVVGVPADDLAERRLGVEHERRKGAVPRPVDHGGGVRQFADAERVGETFAGSIVTTQARRPAVAAARAVAADVVVLPTPPVPQQITTWLSARSSAKPVTRRPPRGVLRWRR